MSSLLLYLPFFFSAPAIIQHYLNSIPIVRLWSSRTTLILATGLTQFLWQLQPWFRGPLSLESCRSFGERFAVFNSIAIFSVVVRSIESHLINFDQIIGFVAPGLSKTLNSHLAQATARMIDLPKPSMANGTSLLTPATVFKIQQSINSLPLLANNLIDTLAESSRGHWLLTREMLLSLAGGWQSPVEMATAWLKHGIAFAAGAAQAARILGTRVLTAAVSVSSSGTGADARAAASSGLEMFASHLLLEFLVAMVVRSVCHFGNPRSKLHQFSKSLFTALANIGLLRPQRGSRGCINSSIPLVAGLIRASDAADALVYISLALACMTGAYLADYFAYGWSAAPSDDDTVSPNDLEKFQNPTRIHNPQLGHNVILGRPRVNEDSITRKRKN